MITQFTIYKIKLVSILSVFLIPFAISAAETGAGFNCPQRPDNDAKSRKMAGAFFSEAESAFDDDNYLESLAKFACSLVMAQHENTVINMERTLQKIEDKISTLPILSECADALPEGAIKSKVKEIYSSISETVVPPKKENAPISCPEVEIPKPLPCPVSVKNSLEKEYVEKAHKLLWVTGWTTVGFGAASFIAAVVFQALASSAKNQAEDAVRYEVFLDNRDRNRSFQIAATTLFISGILTAGVGIVDLFVLLEHQKRMEKKKVSFSFRPNALGFDMEVTF